MKFSLITGTVDRVVEVAALCDSLTRQHHQDFELILVDQNSDDRLVPTVREYAQKFPILHLRCARGLSRARNLGLRYASGEIVAFPDDDCRYPATLLCDLERLFRTPSELAAVTCALADDGGRPNPRFAKVGGELNRYNLFRRSCSATIFVRTDAARRVGEFDVTLGLGAGTPWPGSEEHDFLIRLLKAKFRAVYYPQLQVIHPYQLLEVDAAGIRRKHGESMAFTRTLRTHGYSRIFVTYLALLSAGGAMLALLRGDLIRTRAHWAGLSGKVQGWLHV